MVFSTYSCCSACSRILHLASSLAPLAASRLLLLLPPGIWRLGGRYISTITCTAPACAEKCEGFMLHRRHQPPQGSAAPGSLGGNASLKDDGSIPSGSLGRSLSTGGTSRRRLLGVDPAKENSGTLGWNSSGCPYLMIFCLQPWGEHLLQVKSHHLLHIL